ncbi:GntR family transcriptional regulator [Azospirillum picis]|uniref:DNA-binding GntR family transcriptional regulator n=1 Tax=Azospirillum picis TaxID=488438 RepID=A0ABU0MU19_9PROT|nr:GntR family transcriptional regulator [Azospirillum picis]MBP2302936.1 DNA-binding GntR family transcriptional regulator [Azospirillum picis]MDQ0536688.1 DNA-binding GntR family transcriptional regulator [Azospirillum picis]
MSVKADSATGNLADRMARDIQAGVFAPGMWLKQIDLETRYEAKRMEVRRALDQLALKRLVRHVPNRGYHVHVPDDRQAEEVREVRLILETAAAGSIVANATAADIAALRVLAQRFADLILEGTLLDLYEANIAFHAKLLALGSNRELINILWELRGRGPSAPVTQWKTRARIEQSSREHFRMVEAIAAGDAAGLRLLTADHILQTALQTEERPPAQGDGA